jgi:hypothetical protein
MKKSRLGYPGNLYAFCRMLISNFFLRFHSEEVLKDMQMRLRRGFLKDSEFNYLYLLEVPSGEYSPIDFVATVASCMTVSQMASQETSQAASEDADNAISQQAAIAASSQVAQMNLQSPEEYQKYYDVYYDMYYEIFYNDYYEVYYEMYYEIDYFRCYDMCYDMYFDFYFDECCESIKLMKEVYGITISSSATVVVTHPSDPECVIQIDTITTNDIPVELYNIVIPEGVVISSTVYVDGTRTTTYSIDGNLVATLSTEEGTITFADGTVIPVDSAFSSCDANFLTELVI